MPSVSNPSLYSALINKGLSPSYSQVLANRFDSPTVNNVLLRHDVKNLEVIARGRAVEYRKDARGNLIGLAITNRSAGIRPGQSSAQRPKSSILGGPSQARQAALRKGTGNVALKKAIKQIVRDASRPSISQGIPASLARKQRDLRIVRQAQKQIQARRNSMSAQQIRSVYADTLQQLQLAGLSIPIKKPDYRSLAGLTSALKKKEKKTLSELNKGVLTPEKRGVPRRFLTPKKKNVAMAGNMAMLAGLGGLKGILDIATSFRHPITTAKANIDAVKHPLRTVKILKDEFLINPVGVVAEYYTFSKALNLLGSSAKRTPVARFVQEELAILAQPKIIRPYFRAIIKSSKIQEKINPTNVRNLKKVDFAEVKSLNKLEAKAVDTALRKTDSVVFGSVAARTLSKKKTPLPKDVDIATADIAKFNKEFINALPVSSHPDYIITRSKIYRRVASKSLASDQKGVRRIKGEYYDPLLDVKRIGKIIQHKSFITGKGVLPVMGYITKVKRGKGSVLPSLKKKPGQLRLTVSTQKLVDVGGITLTGFGEQTLRKGLGTLDVLILRNVKRSKDPQSFLISIKIQRESLAAKLKAKPSKLTRVSLKRKIRGLDAAIKLLESKEFAKLLEKKVPGIIKEFPLVGKINVNKLKKINKGAVDREVLRVVKANKLLGKPTEDNKAFRAKKKTKTTPKSSKKKYSRKSSVSKPQSKPTKKRPSKKTSSSKLRKTSSSRLPKSKIPSSKPRSSKLRPSKIRPSRVPPSKIRPSRVPPSKIRPSRVPPSKIPPSKIRPSRVPRHKGFPIDIPKPPKKLLKRRLTEKEKMELKKWYARQKPKYRPSLVAILYGITGTRMPKNLSGFEIRPVLVRKKMKRIKKKGVYRGRKVSSGTKRARKKR